MAGTQNGGRAAAQTNKERYGSDFFKRIGAKGGVKGKKDGAVKGFAQNPERARLAGIKGGKVSRRGKKED